MYNASHNNISIEWLPKEKNTNHNKSYLPHNGHIALHIWSGSSGAPAHTHNTPTHSLHLTPTWHCNIATTATTTTATSTTRTKTTRRKPYKIERHIHFLVDKLNFIREGFYRNYYIDYGSDDDLLIFNIILYYILCIYELTTSCISI